MFWAVVSAFLLALARQILKPREAEASLLPQFADKELEVRLGDVKSPEGALKERARSGHPGSLAPELTDI